MTQSETEVLKDYLDRKFDDFTEKHKTLKDEFDKFKDSFPRIAREEAESTIAKTSFVTPGVKWTAASVCFGFLVMLFSIYGKQTTTNTLFKELREDIKSNQVIEQVHWVRENKKTISRNFEKQDERLQKIEKELHILKTYYQSNKFQ